MISIPLTIAKKDKETFFAADLSGGRCDRVILGSSGVLVDYQGDLVEGHQLHLLCGHDHRVHGELGSFSSGIRMEVTNSELNHLLEQRVGAVVNLTLREGVS